LLHLGAHIVPVSVTLPHADKAFDASGKLIDARALKSVQAIAAGLVEATRKLAAGK